MPGPVAVVEPQLSDMPATTEPVEAVSEEIQSPVDGDSQNQSSPVDVPDPVTEAVETAVEQWIGFDPAIHARNPDGSPRLRVDGSYARKRGKGGRKSDDTVSRETGDDLFSGATGDDVSRETSTAQPPQTPTSPTPANLSSREAAAAIVITTTTILSRLVGPEWAVDKPEAKTLTDATKVYIDHKGGLQMSPEMGLFLAVSMYATPRFAHENTRSKFGQVVDWCKDRFAVLKSRFGRK